MSAEDFLRAVSEEEDLYYIERLQRCEEPGPLEVPTTMVTTHEAAELLHLTERSVVRLIGMGALQAVGGRSQYRLPLDDVERYATTQGRREQARP
jgi:excisionase family DNA binding protein